LNMKYLLKELLQRDSAIGFPDPKSLISNGITQSMR
jgi:hypothetical protein